MEIDYELVEKIGATHYSENGVDYYKFDTFGDVKFYSKSQGMWGKSCISAKACCELKPIPPKPQVRIEYEKVENDEWSVWEYLKSYGEREGDWFFKDKNGEYILLDDWFKIACRININECEFYRRIEKPVDWQDCVLEYFNAPSEGGDRLKTELAFGLKQTEWGFVNSSDFLEMCRVALRATGELK